MIITEFQRIVSSGWVCGMEDVDVVECRVSSNHLYQLLGQDYKSSWHYLNITMAYTTHFLGIWGCQKCFLS